ncbi:hypothetical protein AN639_01570 [Candidatus Epulonipiscium fishelsonii]|uniref:Uncharacterized protein n=1 Tax=Candidatus Epulonipiscium fishelsonii TaxID=77094 RepID=A0ACC8XAZ5_9FIRM|nr:hypothetical protein AN639_01570 [Epulopiscium sp. SCG-B05WGA-EpuloA1]ONI39710.1 hypothetical protein AN396_07510 [Epulopiscium sp. SCG-B11WGA-EpuloA1]
MFKKLSMVVVATFLALGAVPAHAYTSTTLDTRIAPEKAMFEEVDLTNYEMVYKSGLLSFYFKHGRDVILILNNKTGEYFTTGLDIPFADEEVEGETLEAGLNKTFTGIANSLITIEYFGKETIKRISSAGAKDASATFKMTSNNEALYSITFEKLAIQIDVEIVFLEDGLTFNIPAENITGDGKNRLASILIAPFLGAAGGMEEHYNETEEDYDDPVYKYMTPGYIFVPDGSGALIRFEQNETEFYEYVGDVYGADPSTQTYHTQTLNQAVPTHNVTMPVFGIAHGDNQKAFVAYADSGAEYMQIIARPQANMNIEYYWAYPRFEYNVNYFKVYNKKGDGFFTQLEQIQDFDVSMTYKFLYGNGDTHPADYVGMALTYRDHLINTGKLSDNTSDNTNEDIPIRLDFVMADAKSSIIGNTEVLVTSAEDVDNILNDFASDGITNINSGIIGWQHKGESLSRADEVSFSGGKQQEFADLISKWNNQSIDISLSRDFTTINKEATTYYNVATRHINGLYPEVDHTYILPHNVPVNSFSYAHPLVSTEWIKSLFSEVPGSSFTLKTTLVSSYKDGLVEYSLTDAINEYQTLFNLSEDIDLNFENPNMYLWNVTSRFLQTPIGHSRHIFQTDAVPFLQMVLGGNAYSPYINFSFYSSSDILRMIDYNLYPTFILSKEPAHLLQDTNLADYYSTEIDIYKDMVDTVYNQINDVLSQVKGYQWIDREVLSEGVIQNTYVNELGNHKKITINYTDEIFNNVSPLSAQVEEDE